MDIKEIPLQTTSFEAACDALRSKTGLDPCNGVDHIGFLNIFIKMQIVTTLV